MMNDVGPRTRYVTVPVVAAAIAALGGVLAAVITVAGNVAPSTPEQTLPDNVLEVLGTDGNGVQYTVPKTGVYRLTYVDGAYAQGPLDGFKGRPPWLTAVIVFAGETT